MYDIEIPQLLMFSTNKTVDIVEFHKRKKRISPPFCSKHTSNLLLELVYPIRHNR
jgi:hypothetical protein